MSELKACPWCGGEDLQRWKSESGFTIHCRDCGADGPLSLLSFEIAEEAWNTRPQSPALALAVEGLERISRNANKEEIARVLVSIATDTLARIKEIGEATDEK